MGDRKSDENVAAMHTPISSGATPARSSAFFAASRHISAWVSVTQWWRVLMPVREVIHSSLVSTIFSRSALVTSFGGA